MSGVNKVILIGNVGNDPEVKYLSSGTSLANISLATSESWKDKDTGEKKEKTEWHRVTFFGPLADIVAQYVHKGSKLYIEGRLETRKWQDAEGNDRYTTEVKVDGFRGAMQMLDGKPGGDAANPQPQQPKPAAKRQPAKASSKAPAQPDLNDDIPF